MSPVTRKGDFASPDQPRPDAAVASAARTATGNSTPFNTDEAESLEATLSVTAASGTTPTNTVSLETSIDGGSTWSTVDSFAQKTGVATEGKVFGPLGDQCRWKWTIGGTTPSFTFSIAVEENL